MSVVQPLLPVKAVRALVRDHLKQSGARVRARRVELGLKQAQLAALTGLTQRAISYYELGLREPDDTHKVIVATALACDVADLWPVPDRLGIAGLVLDVRKGDAT